MAVQALTGLVAEWFTPSDQADDDAPARYKIKPLNGFQFMEVAQHGVIGTDGSFTPNHKGLLMLLHYGLKDWENVLDHEGNALPFNLQRTKFIPTPHLVECANEILGRSALEAEAEKNSESQ